MSDQVSHEVLAEIRGRNERMRAWVAEKEGRWGGQLIEDPAWWAKRGVFTRQDLERWDILSVISDMHKSAYGYRPRGYDFENMPFEELDALYSRWCADAEIAAEEEEERNRAAAADFEEDLELFIGLGAEDRETAIRWMVASLSLLECEMYDPEYICYTLGIPYSYANEIGAVLPSIRESESVTH